LQSDAARQAQQAVVILGKYDMDVALDDRLTYGDVLFQVVFIQPNRLAGTIVEAIAVR
jgi:head-tail adaptor